MRLFRCRLWSHRRRRASIITQTLGILLLIVVTCWVILLVLQNAHETQSSKTLQHHTVDYRTHTDTDSGNIQKSNSSSRSQPRHNAVVKSAVNVNGRLLKGVSNDALQEQKRNESTSEKGERKTDISTPVAVATAASTVHLHVGQMNSSQVPSAKDADVVHQVTIDSLPSQIGPGSLDLLKSLLVRLNREQPVRNSDKFPSLSDDGLVLVVQVHRRDGYLRQLFKSLKNVRGIEEVLLVISHDYYYDDMMKLVQSVDFCRVNINTSCNYHKIRTGAAI